MVVYTHQPVCDIANLKRRVRRQLRIISVLPFVLFCVTGCVTTKAFKQSSLAMKESSANATVTVETLAKINRDTTVALLDNAFTSVRAQILSEGKDRCRTLALADLKPIHTQLSSLLQLPAPIIPSIRLTQYDGMRKVISDSLDVLLAPGEDVPAASALSNDDLVSAAVNCITTTSPPSTPPGHAIVWRVYSAQRSCENVRDQVLIKSDLTLQGYATRATTVQKLGEAVDGAVQASWDRDDVLKLLDSFNQAVGLAALAIAIDHR